MLGDSGSGKTSIVERWTCGTFSDEQSPTIGAAYSQSEFTFDGNVYTVQIWDTAGEEKYRAMTPIYAQGAYGAVLVIDLTRKESLDNIQVWLDTLQIAGEIPIVVAANKADLIMERSISNEDIAAAIDPFNLTFIETSALTGVGVSQLFGTLFQMAFDRIKYLTQKTFEQQQIELEENAKNEKCC